MAPAQPRPGGAREVRRADAQRYRDHPRRRLARNQQAVLEDVMSVVATGFERSTDPRRAFSAKGVRRVLRGLLTALDRLVPPADPAREPRSEEHTSELQSPCNLVCRLLLEKKKT